jgi:hypothetical protein
MTAVTVEQLIKVEARLTRSFAVAAGALILSIIWRFFIATPVRGGTVVMTPAGVVLGLLQIGAYIWYAVSAAAAATAIGSRGWMYGGWILAAPFLAMLPIPVVSTLIGASPLAIKFLLGGQLQTAIRSGTFDEIHQSSN